MYEESLGTYKIQRSVLIGFIEGLAADKSTAEAFITPEIAMKIIDFVHLLNHKTSVSSEVRSSKRIFYFYSFFINRKLGNWFIICLNLI